jgi:tRNA(adenine34) deaminase
MVNPDSPLSLSPIDLPLADSRHPFHLHHMELALDEAKAAWEEDEVPVGGTFRG